MIEANSVDTKNRKQLPSFGKLPHMAFNIDQILQHCEGQGLLDFSTYNDIKVSSQSPQVPFVKANAFNKRSFFQEEGAEDLEGELYKQLYLTEPSEEILKHQVREDSAFSSGRRLSRLNPESPFYDPIADELNYTKRGKLVKGVFAEILDAFVPDQVTRVRLAYLAPKFAIAPHVDYDPSYIVRYHIPVITNPECTMNVLRDRQHQQTHFCADGSVYFLNAGHKHWAANPSELSRLHLIIDVHGQHHLKRVNEFASWLVP